MAEKHVDRCGSSNWMQGETDVRAHIKRKQRHLFVLYSWNPLLSAVHSVTARRQKRTMVNEKRERKTKNQQREKSPLLFPSSSPYFAQC